MSPELELATRAAREAGAMLRDHFEKDLDVDELTQHDVKLRLDVECQELITRIVLDEFSGHAIFGEEGVAGNPDSDSEWIVDPIDGTVNFFYGIPHFCVSIAMQRNGQLSIGAIYDPMMDEMFAVDFDGPATRNGEAISPSSRSDLSDAVVTNGFSKSPQSIDAGLARYKQIAHSVRKTRMMGSAALALAYIACGRLDAYLEETISIWDIAAGQLLVERGGGSVKLSPSPENPEKSSIVATNGKVSFDGLL
ncbi:MAG: inositol monophosphatase family protein [Verrucomicrobiota bacterium]